MVNAYDMYRQLQAQSLVAKERLVEGIAHFFPAGTAIAWQHDARGHVQYGVVKTVAYDGTIVAENDQTGKVAHVCITRLIDPRTGRTMSDDIFNLQREMLEQPRPQRVYIVTNYGYTRHRLAKKAIKERDRLRRKHPEQAKDFRVLTVLDEPNSSRLLHDPVLPAPAAERVQLPVAAE